MSESIISQIFSVDVPKVLFHYTSSASLMGILSSKKMWTTKIQYLNDNSELKLAFDYIRNEIDQQRKGIGKTRTEEELNDMLSALDASETTNLSVASFTEMGDQLSQWRGYCEIGNGYSLGFNGSNLKHQVSKQSGYSLAPCVYKERIHKLIIKELVDSYPTKEMVKAADYAETPFIFSFSYSALLLAPIIKSESFKEEKEWRLISPLLEYTNAGFRQGNHSLIPYWEFDLDIANTLDLIVIGPTPEPILSMRALEGLLLKESFDIFQKANISQSKIPFRKV